MKSLKIKLYNLSYLDKIKLETLSNEHRKLYNFLLEKAKSGLTFRELTEQSKNFRNQNSLTISAKSAQNTCGSLINNIKSFYSLRKRSSDKNPKFPYKFKSWKYFSSFTYDWNNGRGSFKIEDNNLIIQRGLFDIKLPEIYSRIADRVVKTITFKREDNDYHVIFVYSEKPISLNLNRKTFLSLDLGISKIFTAFSSQGGHFAVLNQKFKKLEKQRDKLQSKLDKKEKFSKRGRRLNYKFKRLSKKIANKNKDFQHKVSKKVIDYCKQNNIGTLIVGDIRTSKLKSKIKGLNKSTQSRGTLSRFKTFLEYKSKEVGIDFQKVNEAYTSQTNCITGKREFDSDLKVREVWVLKSLKIDRDLNSAVNIAKKVKGIWFIQFENWEKTLHNFQEMYMNYNSDLIHV